jgi:hypothetical protein
MKLFGSNIYGVMAANNVSFGSSLMLAVYFFYSYPSSKCAMAWHLALMGHQNLLIDTMTPNIGPIGVT